MNRIRLPIPRTCWQSRALTVQWNQTRCATIKHGAKVGRAKGTLKYWTAEKLSTTQKYPLSIAMKNTIHPDLDPKPKHKKRRALVEGQSRSAGGVHVRAQIVSPDLCDDVLKYAGHMLDKHKGCDILDINPGAGLWSQKLHEYLQPRSHVLLEPQHEKFESFLDPLLTEPGSTYSLVSKDPTHLDTYRALVAEGAFPHQIPRDAEDPKAQEPNNTLLVTGSLVWDPRLPGMAFDSMAKQLFYHFAFAAWTNDLFHAFGLVRTLFWVQHEDFGSVIPLSINSLAKSGRALEMSQNVNVLVSGPRTARLTGKGSLGREPQYEVEDTIRALKAGREYGMDLPAHRRDSIHEFAVDMEQKFGGAPILDATIMHEYLAKQSLEGKSTTGLLSESAIEVYGIQRELKDLYPDVDLGSMVTPRGRNTELRGHPGAAQFADFFKKRATPSTQRNNKVKTEAVVDIGEELYHLECKILRMQDGPEKDAAMAKLEELEASWQAGMSKMLNNYVKAPESELDERLELRLPHKRLQWDTRCFEPLTMRQDETWPKNNLSLISAEPIPKQASRSSDWYEWLQDFIFGLYSQPAEPITIALDKMQHGLSDIIKDCPSLRDPDKGGRLQMKHLRVRMLTMEMTEELAEAYKNWPFKAPDSDHSKYFRNKGVPGM